MLEKFNLTINAGETIALVGHTGAGKSSLGKLVARFYEFQEGDLLIEVDVEGEAASAEAAPAPVEAASSGSSAVTATVAASDLVVSVPDGAEGAEVIELCVAIGDSVNEGDSLVVWLAQSS